LRDYFTRRRDEAGLRMLDGSGPDRPGGRHPSGAADRAPEENREEEG
jgi:hypothetical protein